MLSRSTSVNIFGGEDEPSLAVLQRCDSTANQLAYIGARQDGHEHRPQTAASEVHPSMRSFDAAQTADTSRILLSDDNSDDEPPLAGLWSSESASRQPASYVDGKDDREMPLAPSDGPRMFPRHASKRKVRNDDDA